LEGAKRKGTDRWAIEHNWVSITPLRLDLTDEADLARALALSSTPAVKQARQRTPAKRSPKKRRWSRVASTSKIWVQQGEPNKAAPSESIRNCVRSQWVTTDPLPQHCPRQLNNSTFWWIASKNTPSTCSTRTVMCSRGTQAHKEIKGYKAQEIIGKNFACFYTAEDVAAGKPQSNLRQAARRGPFGIKACASVKMDQRLKPKCIDCAARCKGNVRGYSKVTREHHRSSSQPGI